MNKQISIKGRFTLKAYTNTQLPVSTEDYALYTKRPELTYKFEEIFPSSY